MIRRSYHEDSSSNTATATSPNKATRSVASAPPPATSIAKPFPGRVRRRQRRFVGSNNNNKSRNSDNFSNRLTLFLSSSFWSRLYDKAKRFRVGGGSSILCAVLLWYGLGVVGITTSKLLLMNHNTPPMLLSLQQFAIGTVMLRFLLSIRFMNSPGLQLLGQRSLPGYAYRCLQELLLLFATKTNNNNNTKPAIPSYLKHLLLSGVFFSFGFLSTNTAFHATSTAFVETIKAAEPITSAMVAVLAGIETLTPPEIVSLGSIVVGVMITTISHSSPPVSSKGTASIIGGGDNDNNDPSSSSIATMISSLKVCLIVMIANLCFSFRGLYQKRFRASPEGSNTQVMDDLNIQYRMQQMGVLLFIVPVIVWDFPTIVFHFWRSLGNGSISSSAQQLQQGKQGGMMDNNPFDDDDDDYVGGGSNDNNINSGTSPLSSGVVLRYIMLSLLNGFAFTSYNLASTFILTRISVVHHAALNCIRRIFAIIITSIIFLTPITFTGVIGFIISFAGFMFFTHFKIKKQKAISSSNNNNKPRSSYASLLPTTTNGPGLLITEYPY